MIANCGECGQPVVDWGLHIQTCPHARTGSHLHEWIMGRIETEAIPGPGSIIPQWTRVAYLYCQCGAVKRTVPE